jgi:hypothetical protein
MKRLKQLIEELQTLPEDERDRAVRALEFFFECDAEVAGA